MEYYTWILTFHIMAFMSWMAMLFYLPRLYVYHIEHKDKKDFVDVVKIQEYKVYKYIGLPAEIATILSGVFMLYVNPYLLSGQSGGFMHAKLLVLFFLIVYSHSLEYYRVQLEKNTCMKSGNFFRAYNEVPTFLAILIVGYVISKTFSMTFTLITLVFAVFVIYKVYNQKSKEIK